MVETGENITALFSKPKLADNIGNIPPENETEKSNESQGSEYTEHEGDHPAIKFFDFVIGATVPICERQNITPPDKDSYDTFARDCINSAAWEYLPVTSDAETPKWLIALMAIGALAVVFAPTGVSLIGKAKTLATAKPAEPVQQPAPQLRIREAPELEMTEPIT